MKVRVKLFAAAKDLAQRDELELELPTGATITDVRRAAERACPALGRILPHALWAVDAEYAINSTPLTEHSEIALIPPVSGG
jgi:molybdopterin converting factor small subunit